MAKKVRARGRSLVWPYSTGMLSVNHAPFFTRVLTPSYTSYPYALLHSCGVGCSVSRHFPMHPRAAANTGSTCHMYCTIKYVVIHRCMCACVYPWPCPPLRWSGSASDVTVWVCKRVEFVIRSVNTLKTAKHKSVSQSENCYGWDNYTDY